MRKLLLSLLLIVPAFIFGQGFNMGLVSRLDYQALHGAELNDCWGYVDETGIEYALVGTTLGTSVVSLADPANPVEVFWAAGSQSVWRDIKVWDDRAYVTTEALDGLVMIDLSPLPGSNLLTTSVYSGPAGNEWQSAHNIFIDSSGYAYICGANRGEGGVIILDLVQTPGTPVEVGTYDNWYCHDAYAQGNLLYCAHISDGFFSIADITDRTDPQLINTKATPSSFSHNIWVTSDDKYAVTTDELPDSYLGFYDVSDPENIFETDRIQSSPGFNIIPHNAFILHDTLVFTSYYTDGVTVHSMSRPDNIVQLASYDTHPLHDGTFNGSWGVYPFLPSGLILASDISEGLFVLNTQLNTPGYYEGLIRNSVTLAPVQGVKVEIENDPQTDMTDAAGKFGVGTVVPGTKNVTVSKVAYYPQTISVGFQNGVVTTDTIDLVPIPPFSVDITVIEEGSGNPVIGADISFKHPQQEIFGTSNGLGEDQLTLYYPGQMWVSVGKWGYVTNCAEYTIDQTTGSLTITLKKGYYDDFKFDNDWIVFGDAEAGMWERGIPNTNGPNVTLFADADYDCNDEALITGNGTLISLQYDYVNNGSVYLLSPIFDLTAYTDPYLHYDRWYKCDGGPFAPNDTLQISLANGITSALIDFVLPAGDVYEQWVPVAIRVEDFITPTNNMQLRVVINEQVATPNVTEAAFDRFFVANESHLAIDEQQDLLLKAYPNPSSGTLKVSGVREGSSYTIAAMDGRIVISGYYDKEISCVELKSGVYLLAIEGSLIRFVKE